MNIKKIPEPTISRLFVYLREITNLVKMNIRIISSAELGERTNLSGAQVRKDFGYLGQFGVSGSGYNLQELKRELEKFIGKDKTWNLAIIGAGHLGSALLLFPGFKDRGLNVVAAFDVDQKKIGTYINRIAIQSLDDIGNEAKHKNISIAVIAVPPDDAQQVADLVVHAGIDCIVNFAPVSLNVPEQVKVKNIDLSHELETLTFFLNNKTKRNKTR